MTPDHSGRHSSRGSSALLGSPGCSASRLFSTHHKTPLGTSCFDSHRSSTACNPADRDHSCFFLHRSSHCDCFPKDRDNFVKFSLHTPVASGASRSESGHSEKIEEGICHHTFPHAIAEVGRMKTYDLNKMEVKDVDGGCCWRQPLGGLVVLCC